MSKKSKKYKKMQKKYYQYGIGGSGSKKSKKSKGSKTVHYKDPKLKNMKSTLSKAEVKANRHTIEKPVKVPKDFMERRQKCNHAAGLLTVQEFKSMTTGWAAYTPAVDRMVAKYGEDNVRICRDCFDVLVSRDMVTTKDVEEALTTLYAACNVAVANRRMKKSEVKKIAELKEVIEDYQPVVKVLSRIAADEAEAATSGSNVNQNRNVNMTSGAPFVQ